MKVSVIACRACLNADTTNGCYHGAIDRRIFLLASLQEMSGKERQLATDPDCSTILERMIYSMDDFVRRVFMDSLAGS